MSILPADTWLVRRMAIGGMLGFACAAVARVFDFWPIELAGHLRGILGILGHPLLLLATLIAMLAWLAGALFALYRRQFRRMASSFVAIFVVPLCFFTVLKSPLFDPWLWYVIINKSRLDAAIAARAYDQAAFKEIDVSTGLAGVTPNHFIELIYSESNIDGKQTANSSITHLYGNFYRRDEFD